MAKAILLAAGILAALSLPAQAQDGESDWSRASLPSGYASIETPCPAGVAETRSNDGGEAVRCMEGIFEIGVGLANGRAFGLDGNEETVFEGIIKLSEIQSQDGRILGHTTVQGRRAVLLVNSESAAAMVDVAPDRILLFMVRPLGDGAPVELMPALLDRAIASLKINFEEVPS